ncbi:Uncharacterised protein [Klebsiella pneumoniae]|nr:Uncharacterised protein [Klebsiella pneumoniae]
MSYGWLFESPDDDISGDNHINLFFDSRALRRLKWDFMAFFVSRGGV